MEAPVRCEVFALGIGGLDLDSLVRAHEPGQLAEIYREAGLELLAKNSAPLKRINAAGQTYPPLSPGEYEAYAAFFSKTMQLQDCDIAPPEDALTVLIGAR